jgi:surface antigen
VHRLDRTIVRLWVGAACATAVPAVAPARAAATDRVAHPGERVNVTVGAAGAATCTASVGGARTTVSAAGAARVVVSFRVARRARAGRYRLSISCPPRPTLRVVLRIGRARGGRIARSPLDGAISVTPVASSRPASRQPATPVATAPAAGAPMSDADALALAQRYWTTYGGAYLAAFHNGQCTDWAEQKRPDIVERATVRLWADHYMGLLDTAVNWNGGFWDDTARAARLSVGTEPRAGAAVTFDPGTMGAGATTGHIAYVESVNGDGTFTISEMNAPYPFQVTSRTIPVSAIAQGGIAFVY